jgi:hypothetical protein
LWCGCGGTDVGLSAKFHPKFGYDALARHVQKGTSAAGTQGTHGGRPATSLCPTRQALVSRITHERDARMLSLTHHKCLRHAMRGGGECPRDAARMERGCALKRRPRQFSLAGVGIWAPDTLMPFTPPRSRPAAREGSPPVASIALLPESDHCRATQADLHVRCGDLGLASAIALIARPGQPTAAYYSSPARLAASPLLPF